MSADQSRLELRIDIFDHPVQRALALPNLRPAELIAAVIAEFDEIEYLGGNPAQYQLLKTSGKTLLDENLPLGKQLVSGEQLTLAEREHPLPQGTKRPSRPIYLRDQTSGAVYKLQWLPAIIGRPDTGRQDNERIAIDVSDHDTGQRVSRRHVQIVESNGQFYAEHLAQNPTLVKNSAGVTTRVERERQPIDNGDVIVLENSQISFKVIVPDQESVE